MVVCIAPAVAGVFEIILLVLNNKKWWNGNN